MQSSVGENMRAVYIAVTIASLGGFVFGYSIAVIAGAVLFIKQEFALSTTLEEVVVSSVLLGAMVGAALGGKMADQIGRRHVVVLAAIISIVGTLTEILAPTVAWLVFGRIIVGVAFGILSCVTPLYIAEISSANVRGRLVSVNTVMVMVGILMSFVVDYLFSSSHGWRWMFGVGILPAALLGIGMICLPKSPRWLLSRGHTEEAYAALRRIRRRANVDEEFRDIEKSVIKHRVGLSELMSPLLKKALVVAYVRGVAVGIASLAMWGAYLISTLTFLTFIEALGRSGTFWLYSLAGLAAWIFVHQLVPETKGRSLEEIEAYWARDQVQRS